MTEKNKLSPLEQLKNTIALPSVKEQFSNALAENAPLFIASLIDVYGSDSYLQNCAPNEVIMEALKAATLKLPINKNLGFAYIVPYKNKGVQRPQFQIGYKGYIQLAMRTGAYRYINADIVYEGEYRGYNKLTGELDITGTAEGEEVIGYFSHIETTNGFRKTLYWTKKKVSDYAKQYSKSFAISTSPWQSNFDEMAIKTMLRTLLSKYGVMSVEMISALTSDNDERSSKDQFKDAVEEKANTEVIDIKTGEVQEQTAATTSNGGNDNDGGDPKGPGF